jgi:hypothetical protein
VLTTAGKPKLAAEMSAGGVSGPAETGADGPFSSDAAAALSRSNRALNWPAVALPWTRLAGFVSWFPVAGPLAVAVGGGSDLGTLLPEFTEDGEGVLPPVVSSLCPVPPEDDGGCCGGFVAVGGGSSACPPPFGEPDWIVSLESSDWR